MSGKHNHQPCADLVTPFSFEALQTAAPPNSKGVYIIRILTQGEPVNSFLPALVASVKRLHWPTVERKMLNRLSRLERIGDCPIIYVGGGQEDKKQTLQGRYKNFAGSHTAMYPIWALLYHGWQLQYGWLVDPHPKRLEDKIKARYQAIHEDKMPALVYR